MKARFAHLNATANRVAEDHARYSVPINWLNPYRDIPSGQTLFQAWQKEFIETGMGDYF